MNLFSKEADLLFELMDNDDSGHIQWNEFVQFFSTYNETPKISVETKNVITTVVSGTNP